jgi:hypothetical protein
MIVQRLDDQFYTNSIQIAGGNAYDGFLLLCIHFVYTIEAANLRYNKQMG